MNHVNSCRGGLEKTYHDVWSFSGEPAIGRKGPEEDSIVVGSLLNLVEEIHLDRL